MSDQPKGFRVIHVIVTEKELTELRHEASLLASGRADAALRVRAGWPEQAYGLKAALRRALEEQS